jgi:hypothetical protein
MAPPTPARALAWLTMPDGTPLRNVRVADDLWRAAMSKALDRGESLSEVIRRALEEYVKG